MPARYAEVLPPRLPWLFHSSRHSRLVACRRDAGVQPKVFYAALAALRVVPIATASVSSRNVMAAA